eukprot:COSAG04_NODE_2128_length_4736_cov_1077.741428_2_plen_118_part_00
MIGLTPAGAAPAACALVPAVQTDARLGVKGHAHRATAGSRREIGIAPWWRALAVWASGAAARVASRGDNLMVSIDLRPQAASAIRTGSPMYSMGAGLQRGCGSDQSSEARRARRWAC